MRIELIMWMGGSMGQSGAGDRGFRRHVRYGSGRAGLGPGGGRRGRFGGIHGFVLLRAEQGEEAFHPAIHVLSFVAVEADEFAFREHVRRREEDVVEQAGVDEFLGRPVGRGGEKFVGGGGGGFGGDHEVDEAVGIGRIEGVLADAETIEPERGAFEGDEDLDVRVLCA